MDYHYRENRKDPISYRKLQFFRQSSTRLLIRLKFLR